MAEGFLYSKTTGLPLYSLDTGLPLYGDPEVCPCCLQVSDEPCTDCDADEPTVVITTSGSCHACCDTPVGTLGFTNFADGTDTCTWTYLIAAGSEDEDPWAFYIMYNKNDNLYGTAGTWVTVLQNTGHPFGNCDGSYLEQSSTVVCYTNGSIIGTATHAGADDCAGCTLTVTIT